MSDELDFGSGYSGRWVGWHPDRSIPANADRYKDIPDIEKCLLIIGCPHHPEHGGGIHVDTPEVRAVFPSGPHWMVESWDPLTLSPSILMHPCECHGFIRDGKWVPA